MKAAVIVWMCAMGCAAAPPVVLAAPSEAASGIPGLADYRAWADAPARDWRAANDCVGRVGGWRAYAAEAAEPVPQALAQVPADVARHGGAAGHATTVQGGQGQVGVAAMAPAVAVSTRVAIATPAGGPPRSVGHDPCASRAATANPPGAAAGRTVMPTGRP